ncbi:hypothetical protein EBR96_02470 [bacterium]|nr:hypothetical protein [bacterium]
MAEEVDPVERTRQIMGSFWENSLNSMQNNMRKQLEAQSAQKESTQLGKVLEQQFQKKSGKP